MQFNAIRVNSEASFGNALFLCDNKIVENIFVQKIMEQDDDNEPEYEADE